jgi:hypothetical protein
VLPSISLRRGIGTKGRGAVPLMPNRRDARKDRYDRRATPDRRCCYMFNIGRLREMP